MRLAPRQGLKRLEDTWKMYETALADTAVYDGIKQVLHLRPGHALQ